MKKILFSLGFTIALLFTINACIDSPNKVDLKTCGHGFDFKKLANGIPWGDADSNNTYVVYIEDFTERIGDSVSEQIYDFIYTTKRDTCFFYSSRSNVIHGDTIGNFNTGMESDGGAAVMCHMDSTKAMEVDTRNYDVYNWVRINPKLMIDTFSTPAQRSEFKQWWPLPRIPWPKGESVAADTTYWKDSTSTSL